MCRVELAKYHILPGSRPQSAFQASISNMLCYHHQLNPYSRLDQEQRKVLICATQRSHYHPEDQFTMCIQHLGPQIPDRS